ncbi:MAG: protoheme IX farnesyltransferase [Candidatus Pelagibacterales bacterium]|nr:MAG: protoheme IX farnesyltransferase [Pelagibacterales bacterium]
MANITSVSNKQEFGLGSIATKLALYISLLKPRVMSLSIFTSFVGMIIAPGSLSFTSGLLAILAISIGSGASGALNMWYERDTDKLMNRTKDRALPTNQISANGALIYGITLSIIAVSMLYLVSNSAAAGLLLLTICFYIFVYTIWLKKRTPQNIVIGGAAGAFPPMIGWAVVTGGISTEICLLFMLIFLWTPPHFWALALYKSDDYKKAGIPMMPLIVGERKTINLIIAYSITLLPLTLIMSSYYSLFFGVSSTALSIFFIYLAFDLKRSWLKDGLLERKAQMLFYFSIIYLFNIFSILLIDNLLWNIY